MTIKQTPPTSPGEDWIKAEREHERAMAEYEAQSREADRRHRRAVMEQWTQRIGIVVAGMVVAAVILGITYSVWDGTNKQRVADENIVTECISNGGTWTYLGGTSGGKTCVYLKEGGQQ